jgi:hypothetical protein
MSDWKPSVATTPRVRAFRIVGWILGVLTIGYGVFFILTSIASDDPADRIHRFHNLGGFAGGGLIGLFSILFVLRPDRLAYFHALVAQALAYLIAGMMGGDLISGFLVTGIVGVAVLAALHPDPRSLLRLPGRPSVSMLIYALLVTVPAWIYAVEMAQLQHGPVADPHVEFHHWSGMAASGLGLVGAAFAAALRGDGWITTARVVSGAAALFGVAGLVFPDDAGAPGAGWSWLAIAAGIGFWLLTEVEAARERPAR